MTENIITQQMVRDAFRKATVLFDECTCYFPTFFNCLLTIRTLLVTPSLIEEIVVASSPKSNEWEYEEGQYVGKIIIANHNPRVESTGEIFYTPTSYPTLSEALYQASLLSIERTSVELESLFNIPFDAEQMNFNDYLDQLRNTGQIESFNSNNAHMA